MVTAVGCSITVIFTPCGKLTIFVNCALCRLKVSSFSSTELTHQGYQFFADLFDKYDEVNFSDSDFLFTKYED